MRVFSDEIQNKVWHKVIPEGKRERELCEKELVLITVGGRKMYSDLGLRKIWTRFSNLFR